MFTIFNIAFIGSLIAALILLGFGMIYTILRDLFRHKTDLVESVIVWAVSIMAACYFVYFIYLFGGVN